VEPSRNKKYHNAKFSSFWQHSKQLFKPKCVKCSNAHTSLNCSKSKNSKEKFANCDEGHGSICKGSLISLEGGRISSGPMSVVYNIHRCISSQSTTYLCSHRALLAFRFNHRYIHVVLIITYLLPTNHWRAKVVPASWP